MKKNKDNLYKDLKIYNIVMSNVWQLLTIILLGILAGYLFEKYATEKKLNYMAISIILFSIVGLINFFVSIIRESKKLERIEAKKRENKKLEEMEQEANVSQESNEE